MVKPVLSALKEFGIYRPFNKGILGKNMRLVLKLVKQQIN